MTSSAIWQICAEIAFANHPAPPLIDHCFLITHHRRRRRTLWRLDAEESPLKHEWLTRPMELRMTQRREERRGVLCMIKGVFQCSGANGARGHVYSARLESVTACVQTREVRGKYGMCGECVCVHNVIRVARCLKLLITHKKRRDSEARGIVHTTRVVAVARLCGAKCARPRAWRA